MRLLIVEDEIRLASALQRGLTAEGFTVDLAHTGPDGLHLAQETAYDAVILDIMLPELSGYRIIEHLRAAENWVPILMLTASPARRMRNSSSENSRGVSSMVESPRRTVCAAGSRVRSSTASAAGRGWTPRRSNARIRASRTTKENGLVM